MLWPGFPFGGGLSGRFRRIIGRGKAGFLGDFAQRLEQRKRAGLHRPMRKAAEQGASCFLVGTFLEDGFSGMCRGKVGTRAVCPVFGYVPALAGDAFACRRIAQGKQA